MALKFKGRKRKLEDVEIIDGDDDVKDARRQKLETKSPEMIDHNKDSGLELIEEELKFSKDFKVSSFRKKLSGSNFMIELRHFVHVIKTRPTFVRKYLEKHGSPLELAEAFERIDKTNVIHVSYVANALKIVLMEILSNQKQHMESAVRACRYFLKNHINLVNALLKSPQLNHRRIALKLLTAFVCVEPQLGRPLLISFDLLSDVNKIKEFLSHSKFEQQESDTVRKCYIHFVLSYLIEGNIILIRNIIDHPTLIQALIAGLIYDDHVTVCVVLNTLRQYVLQNNDISKTKKLRLFNLECCKNLIMLYNWFGPKIYASKHKTLSEHNETVVESTVEKRKDDCKAVKEFVPEHNEAVSEGPIEERNAVCKTVHEFLIVLLTSRKHGIAFDAMKQFRQKYNLLQGKIIGSMNKPWMNEFKTDLIIKILNACPELTRHTIRNFSGIINPERTADLNYPIAADFLTKLITNAHPKMLSPALHKISLTDFSIWIKDVCLPLETLVFINDGKKLMSPDLNIRLATMRLLLAMFTQYSNFMSVVIKREQAQGANSLRRFKFELLNHIIVNFPTVEAIFLSMNITFRIEDEKSIMLQHYELALDLVLIMCKRNRALVEKTSLILDYISLLRVYYDESDDEKDQLNPNTMRVAMKSTKVILLLCPENLEPWSNFFDNILHWFIKAFAYGQPEERAEAGKILYKILKNVGIFDGGDLEIDLWLEPLRFFDKETLEIVKNVWVEVFNVTNADVELPEDKSEITNMNSLKNLFENIEQGLSVQAYIETITISKLMPLIFKGVTIVTPLKKYLETVLLLMYHYYSNPRFIMELYEMKFSSLSVYMKSWLSINKKDDEVKLNGEVAACVPYLEDVQLAILTGDKKFEQIFAVNNDEKYFEVDLNGKLIKLSQILQNERMIMIYVQQILFLITQLTKKLKLQREQAEGAAEFLIKLLIVLNKLKKPSHEENNDDVDDDDEEERAIHMSKFLRYIFVTRFAIINSTDLLTVTNETHLNNVLFQKTIIQYCNSMKNFDTLSAQYRLKMVKAVAISMKTKDQTKCASDKLIVVISLFRAINLDVDNCLEILELLATHLKYSDFFIDDTKQPSVYHELLLVTLQRLAFLNKSVKCDIFVREFVKFYSSFIKKLGGEINLESLDESFHDFLLVSHQNITELDVKFFHCMFKQRKLTKSTIKLACLLFERDEKLHIEFLKYLPDNIEKRELIYPLLNIAFRKKIQLDDRLLRNIYQAYKNGFMKSIEKPQKAGVIYKENVECSIALIEHCMPKSECIDFCNKNLKFDSIEIYQMRVINAIYDKAMQTLAESESSQAQRESIFVKYIDLQVQMMSVEIKKQNFDLKKFTLFAFHIYSWLQKEADKIKGNFEKLLKNQQWSNFCKKCLKIGMHINEGDEAAFELNTIMLKLLAFLCEKLYVDFEITNENKTEPPSEPAELFDLVCTHSKFHDIVLQSTSTVLKTQILYLLYTLAKKNPNALNDAPITVLLGAYQAQLTDADRYVLALLQLCELHHSGLQKYRPFIWGENAISFYSLRSTDTDNENLAHQETSVTHVMSLIDKQISEYTIENFPNWRKLNTLQQMPIVEFKNPTQIDCDFGANDLEKSIEAGVTKFEMSDMRWRPKTVSVYEQCYDPAFFVPLMSMCFSSGAYTNTALPVQNGLLAVTFTALSAKDKDMRLAAASVHMRYRAHFEERRFYELPLWIQIYDNIQAGLQELREFWMKNNNNSEIPIVPLISTLFIAKTFNLMAEPTNLLYKQLTMYLRLKNKFDFQCVPEFNVLFYSAEIEHNVFRQFILDVIRNAIKSSSDVLLLLKTNTLKVLMGFYGSPISKLETTLQILSVFSNCVKIPATAKIMIENVGILPWLGSIISSVEFYQFDIIEGIISNLNNLWYAVKANAEQFHDLPSLFSELHCLILNLVPHLSPRISIKGFAKLLNIMQKTAISVSYLSFSSQKLNTLISCAQKHFPVQILAIENIKSIGSAGAASRDSYCQQLQTEKLDTSAILALVSLRAYVINWCDIHYNRSSTTKIL